MGKDAAFTPAVLYNDYEHLISSIRSARDQNALACTISEFCQALDFEQFLFASFIPTSSIWGYSQQVVSNYATEWRNLYDDRGYSSMDPVVNYCRRSVTPVNWKALKGNFKGVTEHENHHKVMDEASEFGLKYGFSIPLHGPSGIWSLFSIASATHEALFEYSYDLRLGLADLALTAAHTVITSLDHANGGVMSVNDSISDREREVIAWAAEGKTSWESSLILGVSESTVRFHLKSITRKLDSSNKVNAISKAMLYGII